MLNKLFIHTVTIIRFAKTGVDSFGEQTTASTFPLGSVVFNTPNELPCRIEEWNGAVQYRTSNERGVNKTIMYVPPQYILQLEDQVSWGTSHSPAANQGDYLGRVVAVNPAVKASTTVLDHYEITIENP